MNIVRNEFKISYFYDVCIFLIISYSTCETYVYDVCKKASVDLFNYYKRKENCQCALSLSLFFFLSMCMCAFSEAVVATECKSMMMMIEQ